MHAIIMQHQARCTPTSRVFGGHGGTCTGENRTIQRGTMETFHKKKKHLPLHPGLVGMRRLHSLNHGVAEVDAHNVSAANKNKKRGLGMRERQKGCGGFHVSKRSGSQRSFDLRFPDKAGLIPNH